MFGLIIIISIHWCVLCEHTIYVTDIKAIINNLKVCANQNPFDCSTPAGGWVELKAELSRSYVSTYRSPEELHALFREDSPTNQKNLTHTHLLLHILE